MSPWRAEPLVYLAWQYARRMQARSRQPSLYGEIGKMGEGLTGS